MNSKFIVLYTKNDGKKRKVYADGTLTLLRKENTLVQGTLILHNEDGKSIFKSNVNAAQLALCTENSELICSGYEIQIENLINQEEDNNPTIQIPIPIQNSVKSVPGVCGGIGGLASKGLSKGFRSFVPVSTASTVTAGNMGHSGRVSSYSNSKPISSTSTVTTGILSTHKPNSNSNSNSNANSNHINTHMMTHTNTIGTSKAAPSNLVPFKNVVVSESKKPSGTGSVAIDPGLERLMRPHQVSGVKFLINRLNGGEFVDFNEDSKSSDSTSASTSGSDNGIGNMDHLLNAVDPSTTTGAILADEMGLGKTLMSLAIMWAFLCSGTGSGSG